jgi:uncharacterized membrane protein HdeD (DUF308 family)
MPDRVREWLGTLFAVAIALVTIYNFAVKNSSLVFLMFLFAGTLCAAWVFKNSKSSRVWRAISGAFVLMGLFDIVSFMVMGGL